MATLRQSVVIRISLWLPSLLAVLQEEGALLDPDATVWLFHPPPIIIIHPVSPSSNDGDKKKDGTVLNESNSYWTEPPTIIIIQQPCQPPPLYGSSTFQSFKLKQRFESGVAFRYLNSLVLCSRTGSESSIV